MKIDRDKVRKIRDSVVNLAGRPGLLQKRAVLYAAGAVLAILIFAVVYRPLILKIRQADRELAQVEAQLLAQRGKVAVLKNLKLTGRLMRQEETFLVINEITEKGGELGLEFVSITPGKLQETEQEFLRILPISFKIQAGYRALGEFLGYLEELPRTLTEVKELAIQPEENIVPALSAGLLVNLYIDAGDGEK